MGPHGAGLINMVYLPDNASVVEFPMHPQCNRCFGYVASILGLDYWLVPEIATFYHLKYSMSKKKAFAALEVIRKILEEKGLSHYMDPNFDWTPPKNYKPGDVTMAGKKKKTKSKKRPHNEL